jgi:DHA1 family tetracycline resistance protein-like MFS transporter
MTLDRAAVIGGWMFAAFSLAQFLFSPLMGNLSDSVRAAAAFAAGDLRARRRFPRSGPGADAVLAVRRARLAGICGSSWIIANAYIADVITAPEDRAKAFGMMGAAFGVGFRDRAGPGGPAGRVRAAGAVLRGGGGVAGEFRLWLVRAARTAAARKTAAVRMAAVQPVRGVPGVCALYPGGAAAAAVLALYFFASSVYPAIWPFWGMARFGWSEAMVGFSLAVFGLVLAGGVQGGLTGPSVSRLRRASHRP